MTSPLRLPRAEAEAIIAHARAAYPRECCGLIAGRDAQAVKRYEITNTYPGEDFYLMEPREQYHAFRELEKEGWNLLAIYHSHPISVAYPSARDIAHACWEGSSEAIYPDTYYIICSLEDPEHPALRAFQIRDGRAHEAEVILQ